MLWNLTGGTDGGVHVTDVTNASRTMLMNLETLDWDEELLGFLGVPRADAAGDPAQLVARRRTAPPGREARPDGEIPITGDPGRPAGRDRGPGVLRAG